MKLIREDTVKIPAWAFDAIESGNTRNLNNKEKRFVQTFLTKINTLQKACGADYYLLLNDEYKEDGKFETHPEFGLSTRIVNRKIQYMKKKVLQKRRITTS